MVGDDDISVAVGGVVGRMAVGDAGIGVAVSTTVSVAVGVKLGAMMVGRAVFVDAGVALPIMFPTNVTPVDWST